MTLSPSNQLPLYLVQTHEGPLPAENTSRFPSLKACYKEFRDSRPPNAKRSDERWNEFHY